VDAVPAHVEGALPLGAVALAEAAAAADAGVVEEQVDVLGRVLLDAGVAERHHLTLVRHAADVSGHASAPAGAGLGRLFRLRHVPGRSVADRDSTALGDELPGELASHTRAAAGYDGQLAPEVLHAATYAPGGRRVHPSRRPTVSDSS